MRPSGLLSVYVTTDLTEPMVPASWNRSLLSPDTLTLGAGFTLVNQTTLPGYLYDRIPLESVCNLLTITLTIFDDVFASSRKDKSRAVDKGLDDIERRFSVQRFLGWPTSCQR